MPRPVAMVAYDAHAVTMGLPGFAGGLSLPR
jgi:hypothetical protein